MGRGGEGEGGMIQQQQEGRKKNISLERTTTLEWQKVVDNLEKQQLQEATKGTTNLKDLQPEGQNPKLKNQKQHGRVQEEWYIDE